jgi:conjugative transposon TraM protein
MKKEQQSQAYLRKRKMMLVLPLLVIPFLTFAFWALGGGQTKQSVTVNQQAGLNLNLPDAGLKEDNLADKLSFYDKADKDSLKKEEWMRTDPYYQQRSDTGFSATDELQLITQNTATKYNQRLNTSPYEVGNNNPEDKLMQKIALLQNEVNKQPGTTGNSFNEQLQTKQDDEFSNEINRLENIMQSMNKTGEADPEMQQLNGTLEKILDIQHPQRVKDKLKEKSLQQKAVVFAVSKTPVANNISLLDTGKKQNLKRPGFFATDDKVEEDEMDVAIEAVVNSNQVLVNGAVIQLRLSTDIYINGTLIPKGNHVNGIASLNDERLGVEINSIRYGNSLFPVKLEVYDMDGLPGIHIPGSINRDVAKQSANNSLQLMELTTVDPSLKAQAAAAGINSAKNLLSRKVKQVKVMVKEGYKVLLKDKNILND